MTTIWTPSPTWRRQAELERLVANPLDPDLECWRAARWRYVPDGGCVLRVPRVGGASFVTGSQSELIATNIVSGTAKNSFTSEATINDTAAMGAQPMLPAYYWQPGPEGPGHGTLRVTLRGLVSSTATPTFTWTVRLGGAVSTAGPIIGGTTTLTTLTGISNQLWEMEFDFQLRTAAAEGGNSTGLGAGLLSSPAGLASPGVYAVWGGAAQPGTVSTVDISIVNHLNVNAACSASSASNGLTLLQELLMGLN